MVAGAAQWPTSEALFAALKTTDPALQEAIRTARTPKAAKAIGRRVPLLENWERLKVEAMMSARGGPRLGHPWPSKDRKYSTRWDRTIDTNTS